MREKYILNKIFGFKMLVYVTLGTVVKQSVHLFRLTSGLPESRCPLWVWFAFPSSGLTRKGWNGLWVYPILLVFLNNWNDPGQELCLERFWKGINNAAPVNDHWNVFSTLMTLIPRSSMLGYVSHKWHQINFSQRNLVMLHSFSYMTSRIPCSSLKIIVNSTP